LAAPDPSYEFVTSSLSLSYLDTAIVRTNAHSASEEDNTDAGKMRLAFTYFHTGLSWHPTFPFHRQRGVDTGACFGRSAGSYNGRNDLDNANAVENTDLRHTGLS
jgi:hypothetical protein